MKIQHNSVRNLMYNNRRLKMNYYADTVKNNLDRVKPSQNTSSPRLVRIPMIGIGSDIIALLFLY